MFAGIVEQERKQASRLCIVCYGKRLEGIYTKACTKGAEDSLKGWPWGSINEKFLLVLLLILGLDFKDMNSRIPLFLGFLRSTSSCLAADSSFGNAGFELIWVGDCDEFEVRGSYFLESKTHRRPNGLLDQGSFYLSTFTA
jgi:hypothetical protein